MEIKIIVDETGKLSLIVGDNVLQITALRMLNHATQLILDDIVKPKAEMVVEETTTSPE